MILRIFSIHDSKAEAFMTPFYCQTTGLAIRSFQQACNDEEHNFNRYAGDYTLFELGHFDQATGRTFPLDTPINHGLAITFITSAPTPELGVIAGGE